MAGFPPGMMPGGAPPEMGGGAPPGGASGGPPGAPPGGGQGGMMAPIAALLGRFLGQQGPDLHKMAGEILDQSMMQIGKLMQRMMSQDPELYQALLRAQTALHTASTKARQKSASRPSMPLGSSAAGTLTNPPGIKPQQF